MQHTDTDGNIYIYRNFICAIYCDLQWYIQVSLSNLNCNWGTRNPFGVAYRDKVRQASQIIILRKTFYILML